jgi:hypothetical protein
VRKNYQLNYKRKPIRIKANFSTEILKAWRAWNDVGQALKENPAMLSLRIEGEIMTFHAKHKLKDFMIT